MKTSRNRLDFTGFGLDARNLGFAAAFGLMGFALAPGGYTQTTTPVQRTDFTSKEYFEPPNVQLVKMKLSGGSASPLPGGALDITDLRIETFTLSGKTEAIIRAPQCTYMVMDDVASSPGHLELQTGDGKLDITGDGFLWRQSDNSLTISNHVHTVIKTGLFKLTAP
jgi:hypothetical protein